MLKRGLLLFLFLALGVVLFVMLGQVLLKHSSTGMILQGFHRYFWALMIGRYSLYGTLIYGWPYFVGHIGKKKHWPKAYIKRLQKQRLMLFLFFVFIEVFFVYNALGHLFSLM